VPGIVLPDVSGDDCARYASWRFATRSGGACPSRKRIVDQHAVAGFKMNYKPINVGDLCAVIVDRATDRRLAVKDSDGWCRHAGIVQKLD